MADIRTLLEKLDVCCFEELCAHSAYNDIISKIDRDFFGFWEEGATKQILFPTNSDLVVKIPFCGKYNHCAEEVFPFEYSVGPAFESDENAMFYSEWNYCEEEVRIYEEAEAQGLAHFFLKTEFIGEVHNHPIYTQKKVKCFCDVHNYEEAAKDEALKERRTNAFNTCLKNKVYCFNDTWIADFLDYYTEEDLSKLNQFLIDFCIDDLHDGNLGYTKEGIPIIIDYAGYREE